MTRRSHALPRILVIDDVFGRVLPDGRNEERADLCKSLLLEDVTGDERRFSDDAVIARPIAQAVFHRAQRPVLAAVGDIVENDLDACLNVIRAGWTAREPTVPPWSLVLLDLCFYTGPVTPLSDQRIRGVPEGRPEDDHPSTYFGLRILEAIRLEFPDLPVLVLSGKPRRPVSQAVDARGALGFIGSADPDSRATFEDLMWTHGLVADDQEIGIAGYSVSLLVALRAARRGSVARNLLMRGESGTGKELLARYVHEWGRPVGPFVAVNASGLTEQQYLTELFGHVRGAFTDAVRDRTGLIVEATGGDLFLDEIATMPAPVQSGLLRVLEDRVVRQLGASDTRGTEVDVRFLFATNEDIEGLALADQFRQDFLERLRLGGTITIPPLRERREDIPVLVSRFLKEAVREQNELRKRAGRPRATVSAVAPEAVELLRSQDWPGNVRALESCVKKAVSDHPSIEMLYPHHFELRPSVRPALQTSPTQVPTETQVPHQRSGSSVAPMTLEALIHSLDNFQFDTVARKDLSGALARLKTSYSRFAARLLDAALAATSNSTADDPEGEIRITSAVRHLIGAPRLKTSPAADEVKRILSIPEVRDTPALREAYETAIRLRPTSPKKRAANTK